eukprot:GILK01007799.1.p1 GENE.GILK01007799.1~~GILK01007799.1.p1  ORF type:complete len:515 (+),score=52.50 GILK01007799.1:77-1621(+)
MSVSFGARNTTMRQSNFLIVFGLMLVVICAGKQPITMMMTPRSIDPEASARVAQITSKPRTGEVPIIESFYRNEYFLNLTLGGQTFTVVVDTGSGLTAIPSSSCSTCLSSKHTYKLSTTGVLVGAGDSMCANGAAADGRNPLQCSFSMNYADGSEIKGGLVQDQVELGGMQSLVTFGEINEVGGHFVEDEVDGIMGLSYADLNLANGLPILDHLVRADLMDDVFAMSLQQPGSLTLGGIDESLFVGPIVWTPIIQNAFYSVRIDDIQVQGSTIGISEERYDALPHGAVVDSGTTLMIFPDEIFNAWADTLVRVYCSSDKATAYIKTRMCDTRTFFDRSAHPNMELSADDIQSLPPFRMIFEGGATVDLPASSYLIKSSFGYHLGIDKSSNSHQIQDVMLGDVFMSYVYTVFDRQESRVGFAEAVPHCTPGFKSTVKRLHDYDAFLIAVKWCSYVIVGLVTLSSLWYLIRPAKRVVILANVQPRIGNESPEVLYTLLDSPSQLITVATDRDATAR